MTFRLLVLVALLPAPALAQSFFELSPGPLSRGHAKLEGVDNCLECHNLSQGVDDAKCLGCHDHQPLKARIDAGLGLHPELVEKKACADCHLEHKGRDYVMSDWSTVGGIKNFDHRRTGYTLLGRHATIGCEDCHTTIMPISGVRSFLGLSTSCTSCHENVHQFEPEQTRLLRCETCHTQDSRKINWKRDRPPFDHDTDTKFPLSVPHKEVACTNCHDGLVFKFQTREYEDCRACHADPHDNHFSWQKKCTDCHLPNARRFQKTKFVHERDAGWPLEGAHRRNTCWDCHPKKLKAKPKPECQHCHGDPHGERFDSFECTECHDPKGAEGFATRVFDHGGKTKFGLAGAHSLARCADCHRPTNPKKPLRTFARLEWKNNCMDCHAHKRAHNGQFKPSQCLECHPKGGMREVRKFDHNRDSRFPLIGFHEAVACEKCHPGHGKPGAKYKGVSLTCDGCHEDAHVGQLGARCERCHVPTLPFEEYGLFDHNLHSTFALTGRHTEVDCVSCHPKERIRPPKGGRPRLTFRYKPLASDCENCHEEDDAHLGTLGTDCGRCHTTAGFVGTRERFDHAGVTGFALTGAHGNLECEDCHPPVPGALPNQRLFQFLGTDCADCHGDPHGVGPTVAMWCGKCHGDVTFEAGEFAGVHSAGTDPLDGVHETRDCRRCHSPERVLTGSVTRCGDCHRQDDAHAGALGNHCGDCHLQTTFSPSTFQHVTTGFPLLGRHRLVACADCHRAGNFGALEASCYGCHEDDYYATGNHVVNGTVILGRGPDCLNCHNETAWYPAGAGGFGR